MDNYEEKLHIDIAVKMDDLKIVFSAWHRFHLKTTCRPRFSTWDSSRNLRRLEDFDDMMLRNNLTMQFILVAER